FGYIESVNKYDVKAFHEKPDLQTAISYLKSKNYYWNSGMFCFKAGVFLNELKKYSPKIYNQSIEAFNNASKSEIIR
ncbi:sugar phosphate nucleotidyltransferase, partial [Aliarcobacter lanthieri]